MTTALSSSAAQRRADTLLVQVRALYGPVLRESVDSLPDPLRLMAGYHFGWWDTGGSPTTGSTGKAVRAGLTLSAAAACGGAPADAVPAAVAVELMHNFTLVHDDVMDADPLRRGRPSIWRVWGATNAILLGDALHALATRALSTGLPPARAAVAVARLASAAVEVCQGQYDDCAFETRESVGMDEYLAMAGGKTAALMGCACALGALCAGADEATVSGMDTVGRELGMAFQFIDDVIGIWGDPAITGKLAGNDLARRKHSLPVLAALDSGTETATELAGLYRPDRPMTETDITRATELVETAGGKQLAVAHAERRIRAALDALPDQQAAADLTTLADLITHRDR